ncbi:Protein EMBRYONIC FLOWER 1 [Platanthera zijinensis]|uniref:Protein EMBRYONIC FLOWER 1 n=1 Tax=Platanthera zijinensis TaxID=2320716 RepID=A0AAP0GEU6_9ASPA
MAVSFLEDPHCRFEKTAIISNIKHFPVSSEATELTVADDKKSNECNHFTIRGYVAEVRKRNSENCFPFLLHKCAPVECSNVFPPLPVVKFRRWGCPNCVYEIIATTGQMDSGGARSTHNKDVKSNNNLLLGKKAESSQLDAREVFSKSSQNLKENNLKVMFEVKDFNVSRVGKEGNKCLHGDLIKEGVQKYKNGQNSQAQIENAIEVGCFSYGHNAVNKGRRGKQRNFTGRKKLGVAYVKDALNTALVKHKRAKLHKVGHSKMLDVDSTSIRINFSVCCSEEDQGTKRKRDKNITSNDFRQGHAKVDMLGEKNDVLEADPAHTSCLGTCCQDKRTFGVSVDGPKYTSLTDEKYQLEDEVEHLQFKKIRKVRLLEDIIRSEKQHMTGNRNTLDEDAKAIQHDFIRSQVTSKEKDLFLNHKNDIQNSLGEDEVEGVVTHIDQRNHSVHQRNQLKSFKTKDIHENCSEDGGPFLIYWGNSIPKKVNAYEGEANMKQINSKFFLSNFSSDESSRKDQDLGLRDSRMIVSKEKSTLNREHNLELKDGQSISKTVIHDDMKYKKFSPQDFSTSKTVNTETTQRISDGKREDAISHSIENKRPHQEQARVYQAKDSSTKKKGSMEAWEKVLKKPRSKRNTDQEALDDIPMDIVELLARNQHERFHLLAKTDSTNKLKLPAKTESIKCRFDIDPSQISKNIAVDAELGNLSCQHVHGSNKGFDVRSTFPCNGDIEFEPKDCICSITGQRKLQIDLSQHHSSSLIDGAGFCNDFNVNCHQLNFSCCKSNNMYSSQSCVREQTTVGENLVGNLHYDALQHREAASFGVRYPFCNNSNASVLGSNLELFAQSGGYEKLRNAVGNHHYCRFSSTAPNASSFMDLANGCRSNFSPADLYSNETISALNLLRLMDQAAWPVESRPHFQSCSGFIKEFDMSVHGQHNEWQLENGRQEKGACMCPLEVVNPITRQQSRTPCLLFPTPS